MIYLERMLKDHPELYSENDDVLEHNYEEYLMKLAKEQSFYYWVRHRGHTMCILSLHHLNEFYAYVEARLPPSNHRFPTNIKHIVI